MNAKRIWLVAAGAIMAFALAMPYRAAAQQSGSDPVDVFDDIDGPSFDIQPSSSIEEDTAPLEEPTPADPNGAAEQQPTVADQEPELIPSPEPVDEDDAPPKPLPVPRRAASPPATISKPSISKPSASKPAISKPSVARPSISTPSVSTPSARSNPVRGGSSLSTPARTIPPQVRKADPSQSPTGGAAQISQAIEKSKSAAAEADYTAIIRLCRDGMQAGLMPDMLAYARRLMGWAYNRRGEARIESGQQDKALDDFDAAVSLDEKSWRALHNRGVLYATTGKHDKALADFNDTIILNARHANAYFNRGELNYELGNFAAAVKDYDQAIRLVPQDAAAYNSRGHAYYRLRRFREALQDYGTAIRIDPENAAAYTNRGDAYADLGYFAQAAKDYRTAVKIDPQLGRAYQSAAWLMATCPLDEYRNSDLAVEAAHKAIELDGEEDYRYLETLAAAQASAGQYDEARETQLQALKLIPRQDQAVHQQRLQLYRQNQPYREPTRPAAQPDRAIQAGHLAPPRETVRPLPQRPPQRLQTNRFESRSRPRERSRAN